MDTIREFKEYFGQDAERIIVNSLNLKKIGSKYQCYNHTAHKNGDKNPSMSWDKNALQLYCFTCKEKLDIYGYYRKHENMSHQDTLLKAGNEVSSISVVEHIIDYKCTELTAKQLEYLSKRGITQETIKYFQLSNIDGNIGIPYFNGFGDVTGVKIKNLRNSNSKYQAVNGSSFGLFNKTNLSHNEPLIIAEGEFDSMIIHQAGYSNSASVGAGANSLEKLFRIESEFLNKFSYLIILSDNDESGNKMKDMFLNKFKYKVKLPDISFYNGLKDISDVFNTYGESQVKRIIESARHKIEGLIDLDSTPYTGINSTNKKFIPTGLPSIDYSLNELMTGTLTLITGRSNGGKSTLVNQIIANAIDTGNKVFLINGEGLPEILINNLYKLIIGNEEEYYKTKKINKRTFKEPTLLALKALQSWHKNKLVIFNKGDSKLKSIDELFEMISKEIKTQKFDLIVLDNLMSLLSSVKASEKWEVQSDFIQKLSDTAKMYNVSILLVLHPSKSLIKNQRMDFEHISGSSDIYNKSDSIISVTRLYDDVKNSMGIHGEIEILKNRYFPELVKIETHYDFSTGLLMEIDKKTDGYYKYSFKWKAHLGILGEQEVFDIPSGFVEIDLSNIEAN